MIKVFAGFALGNADNFRRQACSSNGIRIGCRYAGIGDHQHLPVQIQQVSCLAQAAGLQHNIITVYAKRQGDCFTVHRNPSLRETIYPGVRDVNVPLGFRPFSFCFSAGPD